MLKRFRVARFRLTVCAKEHISLPVYKGSAFRGGFGYAFKRIVCVIKERECLACLLRQKCIYSYIFETPPPEDTEMLRLYPKVPHPFVIEHPTTEKQTFEPDEEFAFHLILIGHAIDYLPYFIYTFTELGKQGIGQGRGKYELIHVEGIGLENESVQIYNNKDQTLTNHYPIIQAHQIDINLLEAHNKVIPQSNPNYQEGTKGGVKKTSQHNISQKDNYANKIAISILTPLRLRFDGHITDKIEFHILIRNLLRRISSLSYFHCNERLDIDFKGFIEKAGAVKLIKSDIHWFDWKRYSTRQKGWMSLGGVTGVVSYEGDLTEFMPLLKLGEYVHVGKGTSFGLGKYEILGIV